MSPIRGCSGVLLCLGWTVLASGCTPPKPVEGPAPEQALAPEPVSMSQLAAALNLKIVQQTPYHATLNGGTDSVTVFADPDGAVYLNGRRLVYDGPLEGRNGSIYVAGSLVESIRPLLTVREKPVPPPPPPAPPPKPPARTERQPAGVVVLDPGHGGKDAGATGCNGLLEKDVVLRVSRLVRQGLTERNFKVIMTRDQDEFVELEQRAAAANQAKADLFVAIHADSATNHLASGHTVYVSRSPSSSSLAAANAVNRQLGGGGSSRGVRQADYRVLVHCNVPAMLVEVGYLSNPVEAGQLGTGEHCAAVADALAAGILEALRR